MTRHTENENTSDRTATRAEPSVSIDDHPNPSTTIAAVRAAPETIESSSQHRRRHLFARPRQPRSLLGRRRGDQLQTGRRSGRRFILPALGLGLLAAPALPAFAANPAAAAPSPVGYGYVMADRATPSAVYTPTTWFNSDRTADTVQWLGLGHYRVKLPGLTARGIPHVTAYGSSAATCKPATLSGDPGVDVWCFSSTGAHVNSRFMLSFTSQRDTGRHNAYVVDASPAAPISAPTVPSVQWNSSRAGNTVIRAAVGEYTAYLPNMAVNGGDVQVTAIGTGSQWCKVARWTPWHSYQTVHVDCYTIKGAATNAAFGLTYVQNTDLLSNDGQPGTLSVYTTANKQTSVLAYAPDLNYQFNSRGGAATVTRSATPGDYTVHFPVAISPDLIHVTALGSAATRCNLYSSSEHAATNNHLETQVMVRCSAPGAAHADSTFDVTYLRSFH